MEVDMQVALGAQLQVEQRVAGQRREHVVEEADPGIDLGGAGPVEVQRQRDVGFSGGAGDGVAVRDMGRN